MVQYDVSDFGPEFNFEWVSNLHKFESLESGPKLQFDLWSIKSSPKCSFGPLSKGSNVYQIFKSSSDYKKQTDQLQAELESIRRDRDKKTSKIQLQSKEISELRFENEKLRSLLTKSESQVTKVYF